MKFVRRTTRSARGQRPYFEPLEPRVLLDGEGIVTGYDAYFTLSFVPDGTEAARQPSALYSTLAAVGDESEWQAVILAAFETWARETNADIGVVADNGDAFGSPGTTRDDARFGDIRIGAISMAPNRGAISVPADQVFSGTWAGDVLINTNFDFASLDDLYSVMLHEAGHVFGLANSSDPNSPMHDGTQIPTATQPTVADLDAVWQRHGTRSADLNELEDGSNNTFETATHLDTGEVVEDLEGSAPTIVYGDITVPSDADFYRVDVPEQYSGPVTIRLRTDGISTLVPSLRVYDRDLQLLGQTQGTTAAGNNLAIELQSVPGRLLVEVAAAAAGQHEVGGYSLIVTFDDLNLIDDSLTAVVSAGGVYRFVEAEDLAEIFSEDEDDDDFNEDPHSDDDALSGTALSPAAGFVERTRFETIASISDSADVDYYRLESPETGATADVMTITVRSLDPAGLIPAIEVLDEELSWLPSQVLASGNGELIVQVAGVEPRSNLNLAVSAATPGGPFATGNYSVTVAFGSVAATPEEYASGQLTGTELQASHSIFVAETTLFQFLVTASSESAGGVMATLQSEDETILYEVFTAAGEVRSDRGVLLPPGTYAMQVASLSGNVPETPVAYSVQGLKLNENFSIDPIDPTQELPFRCEEGDSFCYPGGNISNDTFFWEQAVDIPATTPIDPTTVLGVLAGDWWSWIWAATPSTAAPTATPESFSMPPDGILQVDAEAGVLSNDFDLDGVPFVALLIDPPEQGTLQLALDGSFEFVPQPGFTGTQTFSYAAYDFQQLSAPVEVTINVALPGDFDADGAVNGDDFLVWQSNFGAATGATPGQGDANRDGDVDGDDFLVWQAAMSTPGAGGSGGELSQRRASPQGQRGPRHELPETYRSRRSGSHSPSVTEPGTNLGRSDLLHLAQRRNRP